jgi:hypothetical protein
MHARQGEATVMTTSLTRHLAPCATREAAETN